MDLSLYRYSLFMALPMMLFFGFHMLLARVPKKKIFSNFLLSRQLIGIALLILATNYSVHLFCSIRLKDVNATILMNMVTYFLCYRLFSAAMMILLENGYMRRSRFALHLWQWLLFTAVAIAVSLLPDNSTAQVCATALLAVWLVIYGLFLSIRLLRTYSRATKMFRDTHSDDIGAYIRWLSVFTYWAIGFGVSCGVLTFLPDEYVFLWILSSIPFYIYLYCCYQNYILFYERVENALLEEEKMAETYSANLCDTEVAADMAPTYRSDIARRIDEWIKSEGFCTPGITLNELSMLLCTNRTYLSSYINRVYGVNFRDWIASLRIDYAKRLMEQNPRQKIHEIAEITGFLSISHFSRTFSIKEGCSPARWRGRTIK